MKILLPDTTEPVRGILAFCCFDSTMEIIGFPKSIDVVVRSQDGSTQDVPVAIVSLQSEGDPATKVQKVLELVREL